MRTLTGKQELFCSEYIVDLNATQAAIRAKYSKSTARYIGAENLTKPVIQARIEELMKGRNKRVEINADYVLDRLRDIDQMDVIDILNDNGSIKPISEWPQVWRQSLSGMDLSELYEGSGDDRVMIGLLKKIKWPDKTKNLELLGRHVGIGAWKETIDHNHKGTITNITRTIVDPKKK